MQVTVNIRNIAVGGDGVGEVVAQDDGGGELLGITAFVPYAAIGDVVSARITQRKDSYLKADLLEIERQSPERIEPECQYYGSCGGCDLQHMTYSAQLEAKRRMIAGALKAAKCPNTVLELLQPVVTGKPFGFRRRIKLHVDPRGKVGFYRNQTRSVVPISDCLVATEEIRACLVNIAEFGQEVQGLVSSVTIESDDKGVIAVLHAPVCTKRWASK